MGDSVAIKMYLTVLILIVGTAGSLGGELGQGEDGVGVEILKRIEAQLQDAAARINNLEEKNAEDEVTIEKLEKKMKLLEETCLTQDTKGEDGDRSTKQFQEIDKDILERVEELEGDIIRIDGELASLETKKLAVCGYQSEWSTIGFITYDKIVAEVNEFNGVALDISSGKFTAPVTGLYEVSGAALDCGVSGDEVYQFVYLMVNNKEEEAFMFQQKFDSGLLGASCSGFRYVHLTAGDDLYLKYENNGDAYLVGLKYCVQLV